MTGHRKAPATADKLWACKKCKKEPEVGQTKFYQKLEAGWISCVDFECFIAQGGSKEPEAKPAAGGRFTSSKFPLSQAEEIVELSCKIVDNVMKRRKMNLSSNEQMIAVESIFKTISQGFKP